MASEKEKKIGLFEKFNNLTNTVIAGYGIVSLIVTVTLSVYLAYQNIKEDIAKNTEQIEITQMMILRDIVRRSEHNPCKVSDTEWEEYIENYSTLYNLKIKYHKLSKNARWEPVARLKEDLPECKK